MNGVQSYKFIKGFLLQSGTLPCKATFISTFSIFANNSVTSPGRGHEGVLPHWLHMKVFSAYLSLNYNFIGTVALCGQDLRYFTLM